MEMTDEDERRAAAHSAKQSVRDAVDQQVHASVRQVEREFINAAFRTPKSGWKTYEGPMPYEGFWKRAMGWIRRTARRA